MSDLHYLALFDTETTGVNVLEDRLVTASIVYVDSVGNIIENYEWIINPGVEIPEGASAVHGVTNERAQAEGAAPQTSVYEIASVLAYFLSNGVPIVAYNASYDFSIMESEIVRHLGEAGYTGFVDFFPDRQIPKLIIDPYVIDKRLDKYRPGKRTLGITAQFYGVDLENAHASYDDCLAAGGVLRAVWERYPILSEGSFEDLYDEQVKWYAEQQTGLSDYFKKIGKDVDDINTVWPIRRRD